jgi:hypothetical protein
LSSWKFISELEFDVALEDMNTWQNNDSMNWKTKNFML